MRIFIACADEKLRLALLYLLDHQSSMVVAGMADRMKGLVSQLEGAQPEVLLLDWDLSSGKMLDLMGELHDLDHQMKVIVLTSKPRDNQAALAAGAVYSINKDAPPDELVPVLEELRNKEVKRISSR